MSRAQQVPRVPPSLRLIAAEGRFIDGSCPGLWADCTSSSTHVLMALWHVQIMVHGTYKSWDKVHTSHGQEHTGS